MRHFVSVKLPSEYYVGHTILILMLQTHRPEGKCYLKYSMTGLDEYTPKQSGESEHQPLAECW